MPSPFEVLQRIAAPRPKGERCEMCAVGIGDGHGHVVDVQARQLMCVCRACCLLFTDPGAELRYRAVPERYLSFPEFALTPGAWASLEIPVNLAFFFRNSTLGRTVAFYPGPAGATESELPLDAWEALCGGNPSLVPPLPDVEALIVRVPRRGAAVCHLVPIDACYALVGRLRQVWRGFDGGTEARAELDAFFAEVARRSRPVPGRRQT